MKRVFAILPLLAVLLCACHRPMPEEEMPLKATVPTEAHTIVKADLDAVLKMADCDSEGGKIELTADLLKLLAKWPNLPLLEACAAAGDRLDLTESYLIEIDRHHPAVITALLRQPSERQEDMTADTLPGGVAWLSDGHQAWLSLSDISALANTVDLIQAKAIVHNLLEDEGIETDFFSQSSTLTAVYKTGNVANPIGDAFDAIFISIDVRDRSIAAQGRFASDGAWVDATSMMQDIDSQAALDNLPPGCVMLLAAGVTTNSVCRALSAMPWLRYDQRFTLSIYTRLMAVDGTLSLAAAPGGRAETIRDFDLRHWAARLNIPIQGSPDKALDFADQYIPDYCYAEADSQFLYASTYEPGIYEDAGYIDFSPAISTESRIALMARIPYQSETMKALNLSSGYSIDLQADSAVKLNVRILGPANYILPALIHDLKKASARNTK